MKIRTGFVSNSSSSSFIVRDQVTTAELADMMIDMIEEDYVEYWEPSVWYNRAKQWLKEHKDYNDPIIIPWSTNYDTFIARIGKDITVDTCNNHAFYNLDVNIIDSHEDDCYFDWRPMTKHELFMDLTTLKLVKRSEYKSLYEREDDSEV